MPSKERKRERDGPKDLKERGKIGREWRDRSDILKSISVTRASSGPAGIDNAPLANTVENRLNIV